MQPISNINALIIDMDGVLWHGNKALPGLQHFFKTLREINIPFILATNNARNTPQQYIQKLAQMGVTVNQQEVLTSAVATAHFLAAKYPPDITKVFAIGEAGLTEALQESAFTLIESISFSTNSVQHDEQITHADLVVCGLDKQLNWDKLATACMHLQNGASFYASNADTTLPTEFGLAPGNGATIAAIKAASGMTPVIIGKPEPILYQHALQRLASTTNTTLAIGDRLDTDILGALHAGIKSLLVLTGVSGKQDIETLNIQPDWVYPDLISIADALKKQYQ